MIRNFLTVAIRNILKQKFYSIINILGLTIGITVSSFILIYVLDEISYDRFNTKIDRLYRVGLEGKLAGQEVKAVYTCPPLGPAMMDEIPEVDQAIRLWNWNDVVIRHEEKVFTEDGIFLTDSTFFDLFSYTLLKGNPEVALKDPNAIVLSKSMAVKYFGTIDCLEEMIQVGNGNKNYKVTGVAQDPPSNSHFKYNFILSLYSMEWLKNPNLWLNNNMSTYFTVYQGSDMGKVQDRLDEFVVKYVGPDIQQFMGISLDQFIAQDGKYGYFITPVKDIHLHSKLQGEFEPPGDIRYIYIFIAIGIFIIFIAAINFMNLSTAKSAGRAREIGMRKTFGSGKSDLIGQFLTESIIYSFIAMLVAIVFIIITLPQFNLLSGKTIEYIHIFTPDILGGIFMVMFIVGIISGIYPAFYLTSFPITEVVKGKLLKGMKGGKIRGILVTAQFAISIFLIISTILVYKQLQYTQNKNLGFNKENALIIRNTSRLKNNQNAFKQNLINESRIVTASYANHIIPGTSNTTIFRKSGTDEDHIISVYFADHDHLEAMGFEIKEGRFFSRDFPSDSTATIVNEATVRQLGWDNPLNQELISFNGDEPVKLRVVGVMNDFNYESLRDDVRPLIIRLLNTSNNLVVRYNENNPDEIIRLVKNKWIALAPDEPFEYEFLDEKFNDLYQSENRMGTIFTVFTVMAIFISCLGLFGLAAFTAEQKTKEIGIRKVLGATSFNIVTLLSREFTKYVLIAFIISLLPAYYFIDQWLNNFAYRVSVGLEIFIISGMMAMIIALITVSYQSFKASLLNPAISLKYE